jgi:hypothetical protein
MRPPSSLPPDPVYMALRRVIAGGPTGALVRWFDRWRELREDRALTPARGEPTVTVLVIPPVADPTACRSSAR